MSKRAGSAVLRAVQTAAGGTSPTDRELLGRFSSGDQTAFAALVSRHATMVLGVCRRALPTMQDAEDACQAVFLVLAKKAGRLRWQPSVANWLYATARRASANAQRAANRRVRHEARATPAAGTSPLDQMVGREVFAVLDEELDRLPARYREPLVLCYLEGLTRDEAAARLSVPVATLKSQLERGRKRLGDALTRRGVALGAGLLAVAVTSAGASPPNLGESILNAVRGSPSSAVAELATGVAVNGLFARIKLVVAAVVGLAVMGFGLAAVPPRPIERPPLEALPALTANPTKAAPPRPADAKAEERIEIKGVVVGSDDRPVAGAKLFLFKWGQLVPAPKTVAGKDGTFAFEVEEKKAESLIATAPGYGIGWAHFHDHPLSAITIRLTPDEPITGKVINLEGKPVAGITISVVGAFRPRTGNTLDVWLKVARDPTDRNPLPLESLENPDGFLTESGLVAPVTSDRDGKFEIRGLGRDRIVVLRATGPTTATHQANVVTRKIERFTGRGPITVGADTFQGATPLLVAAPVPITTGRVTDSATGKPVPGAVLWVENFVQRHVAVMGLKVVTDRDGRFTLPGLPPGDPSLSVVVVPPTGAPYHRVSVNVPDEAAERAAFDIKLIRGVPVTVKIIDKTTGKPVRAWLRYGVFEDDNPNVKAVPDVWHNFFWSDSPQLFVPKSEYHIIAFPGKGLLAAQNMEGDEYLTGVGAEVFKKHMSGEYLSGLVGAASNISPQGWHIFAEIDVPAGAKAFTATLALDQGATVAGRLVDADGKAVAGAESYGLGKSPNGSGAWRPPAPGATFTAVALRPGEKRRVMFVHTERKLAGSAVVVGGVKDPIEVCLEPWGEVTGRLVGTDGKPVKAGQVGLSDDVVRKPDLELGSSPLCAPYRAGIEIGPDGRFRIPGLVPGLTYRLTAYFPISETISARGSVPDVIAKSGQTVDTGDVMAREEP
jgi:RNA polymerase sigma factor (sigma-70 family)